MDPEVTDWSFKAECLGEPKSGEIGRGIREAKYLSMGPSFFVEDQKASSLLTQFRTLRFLDISIGSNQIFIQSVYQSSKGLDG
jgi:hypothetical protein